MAFTKLIDSLIETANIADGYLTGFLVIPAFFEDGNAFLINYDNGSELFVNDSLEVRVNGEWLSYKPYVGKLDSDGWPMFAGFAARMRKDDI